MRLLDNVTVGGSGAAPDAKFCSISLKNETAQRALVRPLGALALMRLLGFEVGADEATLAIAPAAVALPARQTAIKQARAALQTAIDRPLTDIGARLAAVAKASGDDVALYGAQELLQVVAALRAQSNTITRRIDTSLPFQARLRPHAPLCSIVTDVLRFAPDPKNPQRQLMREDYLAPAELEYLKHLERDLQRWLGAGRLFATPLARSLQRVLAANGADVFAKFVAVFSTAVGRIAQQPDELKFQRVKIDAMLKHVGADAAVKEWALLFADFGFDVAERPERVAQMRAPLNLGLLQSRIADLNANVDRLLPPPPPTASGAAWPTTLGGAGGAQQQQQQQAAAAGPASWAT